MDDPDRARPWHAQRQDRARPAARFIRRRNRYLARRAMGLEHTTEFQLAAAVLRQAAHRARRACAGMAAVPSPASAPVNRLRSSAGRRVTPTPRSALRAASCASTSTRRRPSLPPRRDGPETRVHGSLHRSGPVCVEANIRVARCAYEGYNTTHSLRAALGAPLTGRTISRWTGAPFSCRCGAVEPTPHHVLHKCRLRPLGRHPPPPLLRLEPQPPPAPERRLAWELATVTRLGEQAGDVLRATPGKHLVIASDGGAVCGHRGASSWAIAWRCCPPQPCGAPSPTHPSDTYGGRILAATYALPVALRLAAHARDLVLGLQQCPHHARHRPLRLPRCNFRAARRSCGGASQRTFAPLAPPARSFGGRGYRPTAAVWQATLLAASTPPRTPDAPSTSAASSRRHCGGGETRASRRAHS